MLPKVSEIDTSQGRFIVFTGPDLISNLLFSKGEINANLLTISKILLADKENPLVIDVGANIGSFSVPLASYLADLRSGGIVWAYEPQRVVFYQLCGNTVINRLENLLPFNVAIGSESKSITIQNIIYNNNNNTGAFSLSEEYNKIQGVDRAFSGDRYEVELKRLDDLRIDRSLGLIKIDVEGLELEVIKGASATLESFNYPPIIFEAWETEWFKDKKSELFSYFEYMGYAIKKIAPMEYLAQHSRYDREVELQIDKPPYSVARIR